MKIGELAHRTKLSIHTLRYYEQIGLLPKAYRDGSGQRLYEPSMLAWIEFLSRLKTTGMPLREMISYAKLREQGLGTSRARSEILEKHREQVRAQIAILQDNLSALDLKIADYRKYLETEHE